MFFLMVVGEEIFLTAYIVFLYMLSRSCKVATVVLTAITKIMDEYNKG